MSCGSGACGSVPERAMCCSTAKRSYTKPEGAVTESTNCSSVIGHVRELSIASFSAWRVVFSASAATRRVVFSASAAASRPFDVREAQRRDDWPKFSDAIESEIQNLKSHGMWVLVDENEAINQGAYIYPCRFVLVRKRNGRYKARWMLRAITRSLTSQILKRMKTIGRMILQSTTITMPRSQRKKTRL